jgi:hypothetical protein
MNPVRLLTAYVPSLICLTLSAADAAAVSGGDWTNGDTWSDNNPAAVGNAYTIDGFTVTPPTNANTITFPGDSITISKSGATAGVLDLARLHAGTEPIITTTLPPVTANDRATLQFPTQTGSNRWNLGAAAAISVSGTDADGLMVTTGTPPTPDAVVVTIPASNTPAGKLFGRLNATQP